MQIIKRSGKVQQLDSSKIRSAIERAAISSTVNLHNKTTVEEIKEIYKYAYKSKLKGITMFRDGSFREGILNVNREEEEEEFKCPSCGSTQIAMEEGCKTCLECGWGACSI